MANYPNFYENIAEALMRIKNTVVLYDGEPVYVWTVTDHKPDGHFRVYSSELEKVELVPGSLPCGNSIPHGHSTMGPAMDKWMEENPGYLSRKHMSSPKFDKFRPFPLGMCNSRGSTMYLARQPIRPKTEQGLVYSAVQSTRLTGSGGMPGGFSDMYSEGFRDCVLGRYPSPLQALEYVTSDDTENDAVGFAREFAFVRGPIGLTFLAYKDSIVGVLPDSNLNSVKLGREFGHCKEAVKDLGLFPRIEIK